MLHTGNNPKNNPKNKPNVLSIDPTPVQVIALPRLLPITIVKKRVKKKINTREQRLSEALKRNIKKRKENKNGNNA